MEKKLKKDDIIMLLNENGATESSLAEITNRYCNLSESLTEAITLFSEEVPIGYVFIEAREGLLGIPYYHFDPHNGFEQYETSEAILIAKDDIPNFVKDVEEKMDKTKAFLKSLA